MKVDGAFRQRLITLSYTTTQYGIITTMRQKKPSPLLPRNIKVRILRGKSGNWIAELPDHDCLFTEADNFLELVDNVNDLVFTIYNIPMNLRKTVCLLPPQLQPTPSQSQRPIRFSSFYQPKILEKHSVI